MLEESDIDEMHTGACTYVIDGLHSGSYHDSTVRAEVLSTDEREQLSSQQNKHCVPAHDKALHAAG